MSEKVRNNSILHVGFPKCASTFLQYKLFPFLAINFDNAEKCIPFHMFDESIKETADMLRNLCLDNTLISFEGIVGSYMRGFIDYKERIDLVSEIFPHSDIIVVTRSSGLCKSLWAQHIREKGTISWSKFQKGYIVPNCEIVNI